MAKDGPQGKVIAFRAVRKAAAPPAQMKATANAPTSQRGGFLEAWLKNHEDGQALIRENLSLKEQQRRLEEERESLIPSYDEHLLYYGSLCFALGALLGLIMLAGY